MTHFFSFSLLWKSSMFNALILNLNHISFQSRGLQHPPSLDWVCGSGYWDGLQLPLPRSDWLHHWHHGPDLQGPERQVRSRSKQFEVFLSGIWNGWQMQLSLPAVVISWNFPNDHMLRHKFRLHQRYTCKRVSSLFVFDRKFILTQSIPEGKI